MLVVHIGICDSAELTRSAIENLVIINTEIMMEAIKAARRRLNEAWVAKTGEAQHNSYLIGVLAFE